MYKYIFGFLVLLNAYIYTTDYHTEEPVLQPFIEQFEKEVGVKVETTMNFSTRKDPTVGICRPLLNLVHIDPVWWNANSFIHRKSVVFHEIAHCQCWSIHDNRLKKNGCPESLMASRVMSRWCLQKYWKDYIEDLKEKCIDKDE